jgi:tetratricopeptide (TPR) repeat protein
MRYGNAMSNSSHEHYLCGLELEEADRRAARHAYEACLAGDCRHLEARINLGRLLHLEGLHADAERMYRESEEADATLYFNLAVLLEDLGRDEDAVKFYREAIVHDPGMADSHLNLSMLLERNGQMQSAYRHLLAHHRLLQAQKDPADFAEQLPDEQG